MLNLSNMYDTLRKKLSNITLNKGYKIAGTLRMKSSDGKFYAHSCNAPSFNTPYDKCVTVFSPFKENVPVDAEGVAKWVEYMNACGFPCSFEEKDDCYEITVNGKDYISNGHHRCGITAIRYLWYGLSMSPDYGNIAIEGMKIFATTRKTPLTSFCIAHTTVKPRGYNRCPGHSLNGTPEPILKTTMLERAKTKVLVNAIFPNKQPV
jgi:hypothetical protein